MWIVRFAETKQEILFFATVSSGEMDLPAMRRFFFLGHPRESKDFAEPRHHPDIMKTTKQWHSATNNGQKSVGPS